MILAFSEAALANPTGPNVAAGSATFNTAGKTLSVTNAPGTIINWQGFSIGSGETTRFIQQSTMSAVLNRVVGNDASSLLGTLSSNGRVFLVNPHGIVFGAGSVIDTAGFVASTLNIADRDFLQGKLKFEGGGNGLLRNEGSIKASGDIMLVGPRIENAGVIRSEHGNVLLAAGQKVTITSPDAQGVRFEMQAPTDSALNMGSIEAASSVRMFAGTLHHSGDIRATGSTVSEGGKVSLIAQKDVSVDKGAVVTASGLSGGRVDIASGNLTVVAGRIDASGTAGTGGSVSVSGPVVIQTGDVHADGASGGSVSVRAERLLQTGAATADGHAGTGGAVSVAADKIIQTESARLSADGSGGAGGTVTVAAGQATGDGIFSSATMSATGTTGGGVTVTGNEIILRGAHLDASGDAGGGTVLVGGDWQGKNPDVANAQLTQLNFSTTITADARQSGDGGKVVVWSDRDTQFFGTISARGGAQGGDGGRIEVSGKENLVFGGMADAGAPNGAPGLLLLDPKNIVIDAAGSGPAARDLVDPNIGANDNFGSSTLVLANGNIVALDPSDDFVASNAGAVHLFNGATGALISTLTGSAASDQVGNASLVALPVNGNFVVQSPLWNNGAGAATWGSATTGVSGVVSATNSLVGTTPNDRVSANGIFALTNGNYVVSSPLWRNGGVANAGAATWGNGSTGIIGAVSAANSLVGTTADDLVGISGIGALTNGNYVVLSPNWNNGGAARAGAATWGNGTTGTSGAVGVGNSLVGSTADDNVGSGSVTPLGGVTVLTNGNYVVTSPFWSNSGQANAGAATFRSGTAADPAVVSVANSLVGTTSGDRVGAAATALTNGNYVVTSGNWDRGAIADAGAATWGSGTTGIAGAVSAVNSLVGSATDDRVGSGGARALANGNYVVVSPFWNNGGTLETGAATWGSGAGGLTGAVTAANSLVGTSAGDHVGSGGVLALTNGNYVVLSPDWVNAGVESAGAATWANGVTGLVGPVTAANSLVGATTGDQVGSGGFTASATALTNGNYVVVSPGWDNGAIVDAGAATWGNGTTGVVGPISAANSLVGTTAFDNVGNGGVTALANGNYVVSSFSWTNGGANNAGAVTWGNGTTGVTGAVTPSNSLVGSTASDLVGTTVTALANGNYVVTSGSWSNGALANVGAVTWGNGTTGVTGAVSSSNSLVGASADDFVGIGGVTPIAGNRVLVGSPNYDNGASDTGRLQIFDGSGESILSPLTFANNSSGNATIKPSAITAITNTGTAVVLQANNDITLAAGSDIVTAAPGNGGALTMQAGRSIILNSNITTDNGTLTLVANETTANGVVAAERDAGAAALTMAAGTTLNAGTGNVFLRMGRGTGHAGTSGDITVANVSGANVSIVHDGPTANGSIVRASNTSLLTTSNSVHLQDNAPGANASIGTLAAPIRIDTGFLEAHTENGTGGIFIDSPNPGSLVFGGVPLSIYGGDIRGVQTVAGGEIRLTVNGNVTRFGGEAPCGPSGGLVGGPICSNNADIHLTATRLGNPVPNRLHMGAGTGTIFATSTGAGAAGGIFIRQRDGQDTRLNQYDFTLNNGNPVDIHNQDGNIIVNRDVLLPAGSPFLLDSAFGFETRFVGPVTIAAASLGLTAASTVRFESGSATINAPTTVDGSMSIAGTGSATFNGPLTLSNSTVTVAGGRTLTLGSATSNIFNNVTVNNSGTVALAGAGNLVLNGGTVINNSGVFDVQNDADLLSGGGNPPAFNNSTTFRKSSTGGTTTISLAPNAFSNSGTIEVNAGTVAMAPGNFQTNAGLIELQSGSTFATGGPLVNNGTIGGSGTVDLGGALLTSNGTLRPGAPAGSTGTLNITGNLQLGGAGAVNIDIAAPAPDGSDHINVTGNVTLAGALNVTHLDGFAPASNSTYTPLAWTGTRTGDFATKNFPGAGTAADYTAFYTATPNAGNYTLALGEIVNAWNLPNGGTWQTDANWTLGHVPTPGENAFIGDLGAPGPSETITVSANPQNARSVLSNENITVSGGSLTLGAAASTINATLTVSAPVTLQGPIAANTIALNGGTLNVDNASGILPRLDMSSGLLARTPQGPATRDITITGPFNLSGGLIAPDGGGGRLVSAGLTTITSVGGAEPTTARNWSNTGALNLNGELILSGPSFTNEAGGTFNVNAGARMDLAGTQLTNAGTLNLDNAPNRAFGNAASGSAILNTGTVNKNNGNFVDLVHPFSNPQNGTINVNGGTLSLRFDGTQAGRIEIAEGAQLNTDGALSNNVTGVIGGSGRLELFGAPFTNNGTVRPGALATTSGIEAGTGTLTVNGEFFNPGTLNIGLGGQADGQFGKLVVPANPVNLSGTLNLVRTPGYTPTDGDTFLIISGPSIGGNFANTTTTFANGFNVLQKPTFYLIGLGGPTVNSWIFDTSGNWGSANRWSLDHVPTAAEQAYIRRPTALTVTIDPGPHAVDALHGNSVSNIALNGTLTLANPSNIDANLTMNVGAQLAGAGPVSVGSLSFAGVAADPAEISNTGGVTVTGITGLTGAALVNGKLTVNELQMVNGGSLSVASGGELHFTGPAEKRMGDGTLNVPTLNNSGLVTLAGNDLKLGSGNINILSGGRFEIQDDSSVVLVAGPQATINNAGTIAKTGGRGVSTVGNGTSVTFINAATGVLDAQAGTLRFAGASSFASGTQFTDSTPTTAPGTNLIGGGTSTFTGDIAAANLVLGGGSYAGNANLIGTTRWIDGTITGALAVASGSTLTAGGPAAKIIGSGGALTNNGTFTIDGGGSVLVGNGANLTNNNIATWTNGAGSISVGPTGTLTNSNNATLTLNASVSGTGITGNGTFQNSGTVNSTGAGVTTVINPTFANDNTVNVTAGTLALTGNSTDTGTFAISPGATLSLPSGTHNLNGASSVTGAGTVAMSGATVNVNGGYAAGTTTISGGSANFNGAAVHTTETLNLTGGTLGGTGDLTVNTGGTWSGGTVSGANTASLTIAPGATLALTGGGGRTVNATAVNNRGAVNVTGAASVALGGGAVFNNAIGGTLTLGPGGATLTGGASLANSGLATWNGGPAGLGITLCPTCTLTNNAGGTLNLNTGANAIAVGGPGTFQNNGILNVDATGTLTRIASAFANDGTTNVNAGTLRLTGNSTDAGTFAIASGATLELPGGTTHNLNGASSVTGPGTVAISGATVNVNGGYAAGITNVSGGSANFNGVTPHTTETLNLTGGTLGGTGDLTVNTAGTWSGGTVTGGSLTVGTAATFDVTGAATKTVTGAAVTNNGTLNLTGPGDVALGAGASLTNASVTNLGAAVNSTAVSGTGTFRNTRTLNKNAAGVTTVIASAFANDGTANVSAGTLQLTGNSTDAGTFVIAPGATLDLPAGATHDLNGASSVTGAGTVAMSGATVNVNGGYAAGITTLSGGSANFNGATPHTTETLNLTGGTLGGTGDLTVNTTGTWSGGSVTGGSLTVGNAATVGVTGDATKTVTGAAVANNGTMNVTGTGNVALGGGASLANAGTLNLNAGSVTLANGASAVNTGTANWNAAAPITIGGGATVTNSAGGTLNVNAGANTLAVTGDGTLQNNGTLNSNLARVTAVIASPFANDGTVNVNAGTLQLTGNSTDAGTFAIQAGATLDLPAGATHNLNGPSSVTGAGTIAMSGATVNVNGGYAAGTTNLSAGSANFNGASAHTTGALNLTGGTLGGTGDLTVIDGGTWSGGQVSGANASLTVAGGAVLDVTGADAKVVDAAALNNRGRLNALGAGNLTLSNGARLTNNGTFNLAAGAIAMTNGASLTNAVGGVIQDGTASATPVTGPTGSFTNAGTFNKNAASAATQTIDAPVTNTGTLNVNAGTLQVAAMPSNSGTIQTAAGTTFSTLGAGLTNNPTGSIEGNGTLNLGGGTLTSNGKVEPGESPGSMTIVGNYVQGPGGTLEVELGGTVQGVSYDVLRVTGNATLNGTLEVKRVNGFTETSGQNFEVMTYGSRTGDFSTISKPPGSTFSPTPGPTSYVVAANAPPAAAEEQATQQATKDTVIFSERIINTLVSLEPTRDPERRNVPECR